MAYLKAMDDYFHVDEAKDYADIALKKNPTSYTYAIIATMIKTQKALLSFEGDQSVHQLTQKLKNDNSLNSDMKNEAVAIIFDYLDIY